MLRYYIAGLSGVFLTAFCQILLKTGAKKGEQKRLIYSFLNFSTLAGYFILFIVTLFNLYAYKGLPLKTAVILLPITFILVTSLSFLILKEEFTKQQFLGAGFIVMGVIFFNF